MNSDLLILMFGLSCFSFGAIVGWVGTYIWLLRNTDGVNAAEEGRDWYV